MDFLDFRKPSVQLVDFLFLRGHGRFEFGCAGLGRSLRLFGGISRLFRGGRCRERGVTLGECRLCLAVGLFGCGLRLFRSFLRNGCLGLRLVRNCACLGDAFGRIGYLLGGSSSVVLIEPRISRKSAAFNKIVNDGAVSGPIELPWVVFDNPVHLKFRL